MRWSKEMIEAAEAKRAAAKRRAEERAARGEHWPPAFLIESTPEELEEQVLHIEQMHLLDGLDTSTPPN